MNDMSLAISINNGPNYAERGGRCGGPRDGHRHIGKDCDDDGPKAPERNKFLDFLSAPLQATGLKGGNQNDKQYDKYLQANHAGNALKGY